MRAAAWMSSGEMEWAGPADAAIRWVVIWCRMHGGAVGIRQARAFLDEIKE